MHCFLFHTVFFFLLSFPFFLIHKIQPSSRLKHTEQTSFQMIMCDLAVILLFFCINKFYQNTLFFLTLLHEVKCTVQSKNVKKDMTLLFIVCVCLELNV